MRFLQFPRARKPHSQEWLCYQKLDRGQAHAHAGSAILIVSFTGSGIGLTPKALIEKRLAESLDDIREGRVHGPFRSASALLRSLHRTKKTKAS